MIGNEMEMPHIFCIHHFFLLWNPSIDLKTFSATQLEVGHLSRLLVQSRSSPVTMTTPYYSAGSSPSIPVVQGRLVSAPGGSGNGSMGNNANVNHNKSTDGYYRHQHTPGNKDTLLHHDTQQIHHSGGDGGDGWTDVGKQSNSCKDALWGVLFYAQLGAIAAATIIYLPVMAQDVAAEYANGSYRRRFLLPSSYRFLEEDQGADAEDGSNTDGGDEGQADLDIDMDAILVILAVAGLAGLVISSLAVSFMMAFPRALIKISLWFNIIVSGAMALLALGAGVMPVFAMALVGFFLSA